MERVKWYLWPSRILVTMLIRSADNYALFALSKHVSQLLNAGEYPWLPRLNLATYWSAQVVQHHNATGANTFAVTPRFSEQSMSQLGYDQSRYQSTDNPSFVSGLHKDRQAQIWNAPWRPEDMSYPPDYISRRGKFYEEWPKAINEQLLNAYTIRNLTCFGLDKGTEPNFIAGHATQLAKDFCDHTINQYPLLHSAAIPYDANKTFQQYSSWSINNITMHNGIYVAAHPKDFATVRSLASFFEGQNNITKSSHCWLTFKHILDNVKQT